MNTRQLKYAIKLSESLNFSQVAEQLNISQPALSKQILSLEKELGVKLFDRDKFPMTLTPAGEYFMVEAKELLYKEEQLIRSMKRFSTGEADRVTIGISPFRSLYMMPAVVKELRKKFPGVQVTLRENGSDIIRKEVAEGKYDFALVNLPVDESVLEVMPIEPDTLVMAVPENMLHLVHGVEEGNFPKIDFKKCKDIPFIAVGKGQELRRLFDGICISADIHPDIAMEVVGVTTAWAMACAGVGATVLPLQFVNNEVFEDKVKIFILKDSYSLRQPAVVVRRGQVLSDSAKYTIELFMKFYRCLEK